MNAQPEDFDFFDIKINIFPTDSVVKSTYKTDPTSTRDWIDLIIYKRTPFQGTLKEGLANIWRMDTSQIIMPENSSQIQIGYSFNYTHGFATDIVNTITNALAHRLDFILKDSLSSNTEKVYLIKIIDEEKFIRESGASQIMRSNIFDYYEKQPFLAFYGFPFYYFVEYLRGIDTKKGEDFPLRLESPEKSGLYDFYIPQGDIVYDDNGLWTLKKYDSYLDMNHYLRKQGIEIELVERKIPLKKLESIHVPYIKKRGKKVFNE